MTDGKLVYVSYPSDVSDPPGWARVLFEHEQLKNKEGTLHFVVSSGKITPRARDLLASRKGPQSAALSRLAALAAQSTLFSRLISSDFESVVASWEQNPHSSEEMVFRNLWLLVRSDMVAVAMDSVGRGGIGMEALYASHAGIPVVGVTDAVHQDPWMHYHVDTLVKSTSILDFLVRSLDT
jgi:hypothetical protein